MFKKIIFTRRFSVVRHSKTQSIKNSVNGALNGSDSAVNGADVAVNGMEMVL